MYGKRIKKKNKKYSRNNVILSLWTISVGIQQKCMPKCLKIKCHVTDYFVTYGNISVCLCARDTKYWKKPNFLDTYT